MASRELFTPNGMEYSFFAAGSDGVEFKVRAAMDAHIALRSTEAESEPMFEIFLGGWSNSKSVIRKNRINVAEADTPAILNAEEFRGFWIRWTDDVILVGREGESDSFLTYENTESYPINFVRLSSWKANGSWTIKASVFVTEKVQDVIPEIEAPVEVPEILIPISGPQIIIWDLVPEMKATFIVPDICIPIIQTYWTSVTKTLVLNSEVLTA